MTLMIHSENVFIKCTAEGISDNGKVHLRSCCPQQKAVGFKGF
jgi:hypothetical protein